MWHCGHACFVDVAGEAEREGGLVAYTERVTSFRRLASVRYYGQLLIVCLELEFCWRVLPFFDCSKCARIMVNGKWIDSKRMHRHVDKVRIFADEKYSDLPRKNLMDQQFH